MKVGDKKSLLLYFSSASDTKKIKLLLPYYASSSEKVYIQHSCAVHLIFSPHEVELSINTNLSDTDEKFIQDFWSRA